METCGEWSKVEQLKRNTGNKSQDSEENSSIEAALNVKMLHFFKPVSKLAAICCGDRHTIYHPAQFLYFPVLPVS